MKSNVKPISDEQHDSINETIDITNEETAGAATLDVQPNGNVNNDMQNDMHNNSGAQIPASTAPEGNPLIHVRDNAQPELHGGQGSSDRLVQSTGGAPLKSDWKIPPKYIRKMDRFLNRNSVHGTAATTKVKGATAPPDELFISRVHGDTTEADMADYIQDLDVHIIDLELTSHYEARNRSFKLTVNKNDFYKLLDASLWPDGVKVGRYRKSRNDREYSNRQYI